jgi:tungstate transport system ATP-binding protein
MDANLSTHIYELREVVREYPPRVVLDIHELSIRRGELFALVGPSGAGKSTLLRLLGLIESPTRGALHIFGKSVTPQVSLALRRKVAMVFQRSALQTTSVFENVAFGLRIRQQKGIRERVMRTLAQCKIEHLAHAHVRTLSGGEAQRVALARALVVESPVLLLDEPTSNLDPSHVSIIEEVICNLHQQQQTTIILVTHNLFQARRLADRTALLLGGNIIETQPTRDFFEHPQSPLTRAFIDGVMVY